MITTKDLDLLVELAKKAGATKALFPGGSSLRDQMLADGMLAQHLADLKVRMTGEPVCLTTTQQLFSFAELRNKAR